MWARNILHIALSLLPLTAALPTAEEYEYIVVGSGGGGGPLASRLARAGKRTLLIEAGDDQSANDNTTVPVFQTLVSQDKKIAWDYYVNHYKDQERAKHDPKFVYDIGNGQRYTGLTPPAGAKPLGIYYPRAGTLGGCITHNALIFITAHDSDWNGIAELTGDDSWSARNMDQFLDKVYEWQPVNPTDPTILLKDTQLIQQLAGGADEMGLGITPLSALTGLGQALLGNPNARLPGRDSQQGFFPIPLIAKGGARHSVRERILDTVNQGYPLTVKTNTYVTKVDLDTSGPEPQATGVQYVQGQYLYKASPLYNGGNSGNKGSIKATKEIILAGGAYNTPQLLKLSGIGPKSELDQFKIKVLKDLPGVGTNMQDRYEIPVNVEHDRDFAIGNGCTFDAKDHDRCYKQWKNNAALPILASRGTYATNGLAATMVVRSDFADDDNVDLFIFGSPSNFTGYFPHWGDDAVRNHNIYSWYALKAHTRNRAGTVTLRSSDPFDTPIINFNYFDEGTTTDGADQKDLGALVQALKMSRSALKKYNGIYGLLGGSKFQENYPGPEVQSDEELGTYVKNRAWGHHASCTNPIGADDDKMAVLDSKFRVRGTKGLRVVDASVFPKIPGVFITAPILVMSEKAADTILYHDD